MMTAKTRFARNRSHDGRHLHGFTRIDLLATVVILGALTLFSVPRFAHASLVSVGATCIDNQRQIGSAWLQYAADHNDRLVNNYIIPDTLSTVNSGQFDTWANNIVDWTTAQSNTNENYLQNGKLFPYLQGNLSAFKCPADTFLSNPQKAAGWTRRIRSYAMNATVGKTGLNESVTTGVSGWVSGKRQFLKTSSIPDPSNLVVFLDEHPDGINDGFYVQSVSPLQWGDVPGSQHAGGIGLGFADGHGEIHNWVYNATKVPVRFGNPQAPTVTASTAADFQWLASRMTVDPTALAVRHRTNGLGIAWSPISTNYVLESKADVSTGAWTPVIPAPVTDYATKSTTIGLTNNAAFFRLRKY